MGNIKKRLKKSHPNNDKCASKQDIKQAGSAIILKQLTDEELEERRISVYDYVL
jgi:hypothetical protein